jgi:hypothetical protein
MAEKGQSRRDSPTPFVPQEKILLGMPVLQSHTLAKVLPGEAPALQFTSPENSNPRGVTQEARFEAGFFYARNANAKAAPTPAPARTCAGVCAPATTRAQRMTGSTRAKTSPDRPRTRKPAAAACPATAE